MCCRLIVVLSLAIISLAAVGNPAFAEGRSFRLAANERLVESGFLKFLLPRFSLKTGIRIEVVPENEAADAAFKEGGTGTPVFKGVGATWLLIETADGNAHLARFREWITGDVGRKTIGSFPEKNGITFAAVDLGEVVADKQVLDGDAARGEKLAVLHCGRCHAVNDATRLSTIGSSPSFAVMRGFKDWQERFEAFFALNPHPSFTIITDVTEPFGETNPPPIVPVEMTIEDLEEILAFVSRIAPADLGAPIQYQ